MEKTYTRSRLQKNVYILGTCHNTIASLKESRNQIASYYDNIIAYIFLQTIVP